MCRYRRDLHDVAVSGASPRRILISEGYDLGSRPRSCSHLVAYAQRGRM